MKIQLNWNRTLFALVAVLLTVGGLWLAHRPSTTTDATWKDVLAEAQRGDYRLIRTTELKELYDKAPAGVLIVDTRQEWEYRTGHIKGAVNFPMEPGWWSRLRNRGALEAALGPDRNRPVVFY